MQGYVHLLDCSCVVEPVLQRWSMSLELAAARASTSEASLKSQAEALEAQAAALAGQAGGLAEQERQLEELSRELGREREQLERLAAQLEVRGAGGFCGSPQSGCASAQLSDMFVAGMMGWRLSEERRVEQSQGW
jgi:hypothetical protein